MREIKFRAKRISDGHWVYGESARESSLFDADANTEYITLALFWDFFIKGILEPNTVGEYTDLKDKNGKEIYEGDIISSQYFIEQRAEVKQGDTGEWFADYNDGYPVCLLKELGEFSCEVIGNIYESDLTTLRK